MASEAEYQHGQRGQVAACVRRSNSMVDEAGWQHGQQSRVVVWLAMPLISMSDEAELQHGQ